jgi:hypothetical protein
MAGGKGTSVVALDKRTRKETWRARTYVVIVKGHEVVNSFPGIKVPLFGRILKPKPSFNYFILHNGKTHCAWLGDSAEANHLRKLGKKKVRAP